MFSSTTLKTKTITATGYTLSGLVGNLAVTNIYNSAGVLLEQDAIISPTMTYKYIPNANGTVELQMISNGKQVEVDTYNTANQMIS